MIEFLSYVKEFYGPGGIYDMNATDGQIIDATIKYIHYAVEFCGDSIDRENVRDIMIRDYKLTLRSKQTIK